MKMHFEVILFFLIFSCHLPLKDSLMKINPHEFPNTKITLSKIADEIIYLPLDNKIPVSLIYSMRFTNNSIYLSIKDIGLVRYDRQGKLIKKIAHYGKGPNEFHYGMNFTVNEKNGEIYVADINKIKVYSIEGTFIRDISYSNYLANVCHVIALLGSNIFITDYGLEADSKCRWAIIDIKGNLIKKQERTIKPMGLLPDGDVYNFENKIFYYDYSNDTIISISQEFKIKSEYVFVPGKFRWPKDGLVFSSLLPPMYDLFKPLRMFETKKYIFLEYAFKDKWAILLIDKKTKKTYQGFKEKKIGQVNYMADIPNDIDGGLPSSPEPKDYFFYVDNGVEYIITLIYPFELKKHISSTEYINSTPKFPEKKKELEKLANSLNENDNPVLMLVKLKE
jgi:hypothetical protein